MVAIVLGMMRQQRFNFIDVYREEACTALKTTLKQVGQVRITYKLYRLQYHYDMDHFLHIEIAPLICETFDIFFVQYVRLYLRGQPVLHYHPCCNSVIVDCMQIKGKPQSKKQPNSSHFRQFSDILTVQRYL